ncbi:unnamed protein product [Sphacelaria rigidula]
MQQYFRSIMALGKRTVGLMAEGLGLEANTFQGYFDKTMSCMALQHYSPEVCVMLRDIS